MIKPIKRPEWYGRYFDTESMTPGISDILRKFNDWYSHEVEPLNELIRNGETVYENTDDDAGFYYWYDQKDSSTQSKALLIGIEPIKKDTAYSLLEEILHGEECFTSKDWQARAKAVLGD